MKQIEKLTQEQERLMYQFRYDWSNFVLQSNNSNNNNDDNDNNLNFLQIYNKIKEDIWWRYEKAGLKNKKPIILIANSYLRKTHDNFCKSESNSSCSNRRTRKD